MPLTCRPLWHIFFAAVTAFAGGCAGPPAASYLQANRSIEDLRQPDDRLVVVLHVQPDSLIREDQLPTALAVLRRAAAALPDATVLDVSRAAAVRAAGRDARADMSAKDAARAHAAEYEALRIAREKGAARACVVELHHLDRSFSILLLPFPAWVIENQFGYTVRAFDVPSGRTILDTKRYRRNGGVFAVYVPDIRRQFELRLREDLAALFPPPAPVSGKLAPVGLSRVMLISINFGA